MSDNILPHLPRGPRNLPPMDLSGAYREPVKQEYTPIIQTFTDVSACIDYIVPLVLCKKKIITHLTRLVTDKGNIITSMPIYKYDLEYDIDDKDKVTLNALEFRDGADYEFVTVNKMFGWVTSKHIGLGNLVSIELLTTLIPTCHDIYHDERAGEYDIRSSWL